MTSFVEDIQAMIVRLEHDKRYSPYTLFIPLCHLPFTDRRRIRRLSRKTGLKFTTRDGGRPRLYFLNERAFVTERAF